MRKGGCQEMRFAAVFNRLNREWLNNKEGMTKGLHPVNHLSP